MTGKNYQRYTARNSININFIVAIRVARARVVMSQAVYSDDILMTPSRLVHEHDKQLGQRSG